MSVGTRKKSPLDPILAMMLTALAIAIACSMMLGAAGTREPELYDCPLIHTAAAPSPKPFAHFVRAPRAP